MEEKTCRDLLVHRITECLDSMEDEEFFEYMYIHYGETLAVQKFRDELNKKLKKEEDEEAIMHLYTEMETAHCFDC